MLPFKNIYLLNRQISSLFKTSNNYEGMTAMPPCDLFETKDKYYLIAELPGLLENEILIEVEGSLLKLKGERAIKYDGSCYYQIERSSGQFRRIFKFPQEIDKNNINAKLKDGLLEIEISKF
ncbi:MAG: Hsp20/alpha crystallin family protein [Thermodesulfovibrionales bacterium]|nr:Hsp20/alpha crystallin family protein [Thermodesulfovibrionales bacterium]